MSGFTNDIMNAENVNFTGSNPTVGDVTADGELLIGSSVAPFLQANTLTPGTGVDIANGPGSITISLDGSAAGQTITGNNLVPLSPTGGNWNIVGSGSLTTSGSGSTLTASVTGLTNHNVLVGAGTATITKVAPSATSGVPLISQGASSDPAFGTAVVAGGGTGITTTTAYGLIAGGTTATGNFQNTGTGAANSTVLIGNGNAALPSFSATPSVTSITLSSGTALSNYLQGTFTPGIAFGGGTTGITYASQIGKYTRIGNLVFFNFKLTITSKGTSTGNASITGFPLAAAVTNEGASFYLVANLTYSAPVGILFLATSTSASVVSSTTGINSVTLTDANFTATTILFCSGFYSV